MDDHIASEETRDIADNLSLGQQNAIDLLVQGHNDRQVAEALNVSRQTVCDWRNHNNAFSAELSRRRQNLRDSHADRLGHIAATAIEVLATDLAITEQYPNDGNRRIRQAAAVQVLRAYGTLNREALSKTAQPAAKPETPKPQSQALEHDPLDLFYDFPPGG
jgi:hypothetical protein